MRSPACSRLFSFAPGAAEVTYRDESCPLTTRPDDGRTTSVDWQSLPSATGVGAQVEVERMAEKQEGESA